MHKSRRTLATLLIGSFIACAAPAVGEASETQTALHQELQLTVAMLEQERKELIAESLQMPATATAFWRVYNAYRKKMRAIADRRSKIITEYADALYNQHLRDKQITKLLNRSLNVFQDQIKVKKAFVHKFSKVLTARQMARFYQVDQRIDLLIQAEIAKLVPLVATTPKGAQ